MDTLLLRLICHAMGRDSVLLGAVPTVPRASLASCRLHPSLVATAGAAHAGPLQSACSRQHHAVLMPGDSHAQGSLSTHCCRRHTDDLCCQVPLHTLLQVKYVLGIRATKSSRLQDMLLSMGQHIQQVRWQECVMGASWLALLFSVRAVSKHSKRGWVAALGPILTAGFSMAAVWLLGLPQIDTVGHIRHGLPGLTIQWWFPIPAGEQCEEYLLCVSVAHDGPHQGRAPSLRMHRGGPFGQVGCPVWAGPSPLLRT